MLLKVLVCFFLFQTCLASPTEMFSEEDISIEMPSRKTSSSNTVFLENEDMFFNFIKKLVDTAHKSSSIALRRIQKDADKREKLQEEIGDFLSTFKGAQIPIVDNLPRLLPNNNNKEVKEVKVVQKEQP
ncbi:unnamed protein product [Brassicogethes aeneus]|uniref:Uncharacterized protein n=1 Tax=Brassicogethes aeneus TaxID=1431903 RepID=A0A9P0AVA6_BRAAE|nr:unnamed protein product [Brassicogethes aeneus]